MQYHTFAADSDRESRQHYTKDRNAVTAERVMLAILFADVSDSTRLYEQIGDTGAFGMIKDCMETLTQVTSKFGGWVVKTIGDGTMSIFSAGVYLDKVVETAEGLRFAERIVVQDSRRVETLLIIPL